MYVNMFGGGGGLSDAKEPSNVLWAPCAECAETLQLTSWNCQLVHASIDARRLAITRTGGCGRIEMHALQARAVQLGSKVALQTHTLSFCYSPLLCM
jgi:hypothetical protein